MALTAGVDEPLASTHARLRSRRPLRLAAEAVRRSSSCAGGLQRPAHPDPRQGLPFRDRHTASAGTPVYAVTGGVAHVKRDTLAIVAPGGRRDLRLLARRSRRSPPQARREAPAGRVRAAAGAPPPPDGRTSFPFQRAVGRRVPGIAPARRAHAVGGYDGADGRPDRLRPRLAQVVTARAARPGRRRRGRIRPATSRGAAALGKPPRRARAPSWRIVRGSTVVRGWRTPVDFREGAAAPGPVRAGLRDRARARTRRRCRAATASFSRAGGARACSLTAPTGSRSRPQTSSAIRGVARWSSES